MASVESESIVGGRPDWAIVVDATMIAMPNNGELVVTKATLYTRRAMAAQVFGFT